MKFAGGGLQNFIALINGSKAVNRPGIADEVCLSTGAIRAQAPMVGGEGQKLVRRWQPRVLTAESVQVGGPVEPFSICAGDAVLYAEPGAQGMSVEEPESVPVKLSELVDAFEFMSVSDLDEHQAYICKRTGRIIFVADGVDIEEDIELPDDPELADYLPVPRRRDLDLGRRLALSFVAERIPGSFDKAREIFSEKGGYSGFKQLLQATGTLDKWYAFEARATETALAEWCDEVGVTLIDIEQPA